MPGADLCAVVLHYRNAAMTADCLLSLVGAGIARVVVVDNSADQGTSWNTARARFETAGRSDADVVVHAAPRNLGFAAGANAGLELALDSFGPCTLLFFNNDARLPHGAGEVLRQAGASAGMVLAAPRLRTAGRVESPLRHSHAATGLQFPTPAPGTVPYLSGSALVLGAAAVEAGVRWDEAFFFYGEDVALSSRVLRAGGELRVLDELVCEHQGAASSRRYSHFYEYNLSRANRLLSHRLMAPAWRVASWPLRESVLLSRALLHAARSRSLAPLAGYFGAPPPLETR